MQLHLYGVLDSSLWLFRVFMVLIENRGRDSLRQVELEGDAIVSRNKCPSTELLAWLFELHNDPGGFPFNLPYLLTDLITMSYLMVLDVCELSILFAFYFQLELLSVGEWLAQSHVYLASDYVIGLIKRLVCL